MSTLKDKMMEKKSASSPEDDGVNPTPSESQEPNPEVEDLSGRDIQLSGVEDANKIGLDAMALATKIALSKQPLIPTYIPLDPGEKVGTQKYAAINCYPFFIQKGVMVNTPRDIHDLVNNTMLEASRALEKSPDRKIG